MKVINMRWGYTGTQWSCGPMEGDTVVETQVQDGEGRDAYVLMRRMGEFCQLLIGREPLFDLAMGACEEENFQKLQAAAFETYDFERESDDPEDYDEEDEIPSGMELYSCPELSTSPFAAPIRLTLMASEACYALQEPTEQDARRYAANYLGRDTDTMELEF